MGDGAEAGGGAHPSAGGGHRNDTLAF
jgi:hypothetical protein